MYDSRYESWQQFCRPNCVRNGVRRPRGNIALQKLTSKHSFKSQQLASFSFGPHHIFQRHLGVIHLMNQGLGKTNSDEQRAYVFLETNYVKCYRLLVPLFENKMRRNVLILKLLHCKQRYYQAYLLNFQGLHKESILILRFLDCYYLAQKMHLKDCIPKWPAKLAMALIVTTSYNLTMLDIPNEFSNLKMFQKPNCTQMCLVHI